MAERLGDSASLEYKNLTTKRSHQQGAVRSSITALRRMLVAQDEATVDKCETALKDVKEKFSKFFAVHRQLLDFCIQHDMPDKDFIEKAKLLDDDITQIQSDAEDWIFEHSEPPPEETTVVGIPVGEISTVLFPPDKAGDFTSAGGMITISEVEYVRQNQDRDHEIAILRQKENDAMRQQQQYNQLQEQMRTMQDSFKKQSLKDQSEVLYYKDAAGRLQQELTDTRAHQHTRTASPSAGSRVPFVTSTPGGDATVMSRSTMSQDDLFAISHVFAESNAEMMREMMNTSVAQNRVLCQSITGPRSEIPLFAGDCTKFTPFINRFNEQVGNTTRSDSAKLNTLLQYCAGDVLQLLDCCNYQDPSEGYKLARKLLKQTYGKPFLIAQAWIDKLLDYPKLKSTELMTKFSAELGSARETLRAIGHLPELECARTMKQIVLKLPLYVQNRWRTQVQNREDKDQVATIDDLIKIVSSAAREMADPVYGIDSMNRLAASIETKSRATAPVKKKTSESYPVQPQQGLKARGKREIDATTAPRCFVCAGQHFTSRCYRYRDLGATERLEFVTKNSLCYLCLYPGHVAEACEMKFTCQAEGCKMKHNSSLHRALSGDKVGLPRPVASTSVKSMYQGDIEEDAYDSDPDVDEFVQDPESEPRGSRPLYHPDADNTPVMFLHLDESSFPMYRMHSQFSLPIVCMYIDGPDGWYATHAVIDTGSAITMCSSDVSRALSIQPVAKAHISLRGVNTVNTFSADVLDVWVRGKSESVWYEAIGVIANPDMVINQRYVADRRHYNKWEHMSSLNFSCHANNRIDFLVGQDNAHLFEQMEKVPGHDLYSPYAVKTRLGWTVFGHSSHRKDFYQCVTADTERVSEPGLEQALDRMWSIDQVPDTAGHSPVNAGILKMWDQQTQLIDGHLHIPIPFKQSPPQLINNLGPVRARLDALGRRLKANPDLCKQYVASMRDNFDRGYASVVTHQPEPGMENYVPHHEVISENRPGKCRIVGNLSFMYKGTCINLEVYQGPNMGTKLTLVMVAFRLYPVVVTGDIKHMFNQVMVPTDQRDALRFLWWKDDEPGGEVIVCCMNTHMFGGGWCSSVSMYAMRKAGEMYGNEYDPIVATTIDRNFYVDDLLKSIISISVGLRLVLQLRELLGRVGFDLTKFGANRPEIVDALPVEIRAPAFETVEFKIHPEIVEKTLGSFWRPGEDVFGFVMNQLSRPDTRRGMLSTFSSVYDPLGLVSPYVLRARMMIQGLCRKGASWDEELPEVILLAWNDWKSQLPELETLKFERWLGASDDPDLSYQLHVFSDASEKGYGAIVYFCVLDHVGEIVKSTLLISKAKVSPIKNVTIPRLELSAAVLGVSLEHQMVADLEVRLLPTVFWTDSQLVLHYVKQTEREFRTFVANRISYIHERSDPAQWRFVPGELNPADIVSRGASVEDLRGNDLWSHGPGYLFDRTMWPGQFVIGDAQVEGLEIKLNTSRYDCGLLDAGVKIGYESIKKLCEYYSYWPRMVRAVAYWIKLVDILKGDKKGVHLLTTKEYQAAEYRIFQAIQESCITPSQRSSKSFRKLFPISDDGLIRVGGRLMLSSLSREEKHPIVMPPCNATDVYVSYIHAIIGHLGVTRTFGEIRRRCWLLGGKSVVKKVVGRCVLCKKLRARAAEQVMAPLPRCRTEQGRFPFEIVGIDYFGPLYVRIGRSQHKRWICIFTDMKMRATHLEVAGDLSTSSFLNALQRFVSRRGKPLKIISDNGSNFVGAARELKELVVGWNKGHVQTWMQERHIEWQFNTPLASHHGGIWERAIRTAQSLFMSLGREQTLSDESLSTLCCLVEEIMNSRPLTKVTEDATDPTPLTPQHLLSLRETEGIVGDYAKSDLYKRRWRQVQYLADQFWSRWSMDYLRSLQERHKWQKEVTNFEVGDLVLVMTAGMPRLKWPLGLILEVFKGNDGNVRSVRVKTRDGQYERPIAKLIGLEIK